jgi:hypothetical protein
VAPCHSPTGANGVNELQEEDLDCRPADAGKPGPCTRLYLTSTHSHRGSCPASPGEPEPRCDSPNHGGFRRAGQLSSEAPRACLRPGAARTTPCWPCLASRPRTFPPSRLSSEACRTTSPAAIRQAADSDVIHAIAGLVGDVAAAADGRRLLLSLDNINHPQADDRARPMDLGPTLPAGTSVICAFTSFRGPDEAILDQCRLAGITVCAQNAWQLTACAGGYRTFAGRSPAALWSALAGQHGGSMEAGVRRA